MDRLDPVRAPLVDEPKSPVPHRTTYTESARHKRLDHLARQTANELSQLRTMRLDPSTLRGNIECLIGAVEIPVGAAGPLLINGSSGKVEVFAPIATTEGALLSSINRGSRALSLSGGVTARALKQRMVRAPLFDCGNLRGCLLLRDWLQSQMGEIHKKVRQYSNHAILLQLEFRILAPCLHVRFVFETGDASGQNMTTVCTWNTCTWLLNNFAKDHPGVVRHFMVEGNLSTDKKASSLSVFGGRGHEVAVDALIPEAILQRVLRTTSEDMVRSFVQSQSTCGVTGVHGYNINIANVIAGIFTATGQDIACVHEASQGQLHMERRPEGLYVSLLLPTLVVGSVGGGVGLAMQKQLLGMMGCYGPKKSSHLAEVIASFALALEVSTGASLVGGQFVTAHERLGRNKVNHWLGLSDMTPAFFNHLLEPCEDWGAIVEVCPISSENNGESLVIELTSQISRRPCGLWAFDLQYANRLGKEKVFLKSKVSDNEFLLATEIMAGISSPGLGELLRENRSDNPFNRFHVREVRIAEMQDTSLRNVMPKIRGTMINDKREVYIIAQEYLENLELTNAVEMRSRWGTEPLRAAIDQIASVHGQFMHQTEKLQQVDWMHIMTPERVGRLTEANLQLAQHLQVGGYDWFSDEDIEFHRRHLMALPEIFKELGRMPQTLIHNDFNPRNMGFRRNGEKLQLVAYDWELATVQVPQRDVVELLAFTLKENFTREDLLEFVEYHRERVEYHSGQSLDPWQWLRGCSHALLDLILQRFPIYGIAQTFRQVPFLRPSYQCARRMFDFLQKG